MGKTGREQQEKKQIQKKQSGGDSSKNEVNDYYKSSLSGPLGFLDELDTAASHLFYDWAQSISIVKLFFTIVTLSVDELVVFPVTALTGAALYNLSSSEEGILAGAQLLRLFGDFGACCLVEQGLKYLFGRARPFWKNSSGTYAMPAEWFGFPSGHTQRAMYGVFLILYYPEERSPWITLGIQQAIPKITVYLILAYWVIVCGLSRVALGKHRFGDIIFGSFIGVLFALSPYPLAEPRGTLRILLASTFTVELTTVMAFSKYRKMIPYWPGLGMIVVTFWLTFPFAL